MASDSETATREAPRRSGAREGTASEYRPPYRWALFVGIGVFVIYAITLAPTTAFWDTSEYIATGHILGIPHPPGNPVFVFLARTWELLLSPLPLSTAVKINLFSATNSAAAAAFWFLVTHRVLAFFSEDELFRRLGATAAAALSATAFTVWNQSVVNEKVYTVSLMTIALLTWLIFHWRDNLGRGKDNNLLVLIVFLLALSVGNHLMAFLAAPALGIFVIWVRPQVLARWRLYAFAALAGALGLSAQLFLPIRADSRPVIAEADPRCESLVEATVDIMTFGHTDLCEALSSALRREQYQKPPLTVNPIHYRPGRRNNPPRDFKLLAWQFINYFQYFDWQWARSLHGRNTFFAWPRIPFTMLFLALGLVGAWRHYQHDRTSWIYFATLFATVSVGLVIYLNFKYGYSVGVTVDTGAGGPSPAPPGWREVRERDYFFIVSFSHWGLWAGIGLASVWRSFARRLSGAGGTRIPGNIYRRTAPILLVALLPMILNWRYASRAGEYAARDWAYNLLMSVEPYGVVFTNGDNDTFPLWYLQEVEGLRRDVTVIVYSYLATPWYAEQLRDLTRPCDGKDPLADPTTITCQRPFEPEEAIESYEGRDWPKPTRSILELNNAEIAGIPECYPQDDLGNCAVFDDTLAVPIGGDIQGYIERGEYLVRNDILVLRILQTAAGDRPVYFASTTGTFEQFSLQPHMVRQGVAFKVSTERLQPSDSLILMPRRARLSGGRGFPYWLDLPTTEALLNEYYIHRDLPEEEIWVDLSTNGIPMQYWQAYASLANAYALQGMPEKAQEFVNTGWNFVELAYGDQGEPPAVPQPGPAPDTP